jgi:hypothetical protein
VEAVLTVSKESTHKLTDHVTATVVYYSTKDDIMANGFDFKCVMFTAKLG